MAVAGKTLGLFYPLHSAHGSRNDTGSSPLYPIQKVTTNINVIKKRKEHILRPLQKLAPYAHEYKPIFDWDYVIAGTDTIYDCVRTIPKTAEDLVNVVQSWLKLQSQLPDVPLSWQQQLVQIILSELRSIWDDFHQIQRSPYLTADENAEMLKRVVVQIISTCQQLFQSCLRKSHVLNRRGVFNADANYSRLRSQLTVNIANMLCVDIILRDVLCEMRGLSIPTKLSGPTATVHMGQSTLTDHAFTPRPLYRVALQTLKARKSSLQKNLDEMQRKMPSIDIEKLTSLRASCPEVPSPWLRDTALAVTDEQKESVLYSDSVEQNVTVDTHGAVQNLPLDGVEGCRSPLPSDEISESDSSLTTDTEEAAIAEQEAKEDIMRGTHAVDECNLPPLLKADLRSPERTARLAVLQERLRLVLQKQEQRRQQQQQRAEIRKQGAAKSKPQGDVVLSTLPNQMVVQASAARVSERVWPSKILLKPYNVIYNHLNQEISRADVQWLDRNLFLQQHLAEVYREIMKTACEEYLDIENNIRLQPAAEVKAAALRPFVTSALLRNEQLVPIINERLHEQYVSCPEQPRAFQRPCQLLQCCEDGRSWRPPLSSTGYMTWLQQQDTDYLTVIFHQHEQDKESLIPEEKEEGHIRERRAAERQDRAISRKPERGSVDGVSAPPGGSSVAESGGEAMDSEQPSACERLERVWSTLCMTDAQKLDMALKYSSGRYARHLDEAAELWEQSAQLVIDREKVIAKLERFERTASDPARFFNRESSGERLREAAYREKLDNRLASLQPFITKALRQVSQLCNDTITYKGRPYEDKMKWDRTEMLYWLQEERRQQAIAQWTPPDEQLSAVNNLSFTL
ncbi:PREDICTED: uncharacterized protein LOC106821108 [Priapulus caudatus]|uniref:Uncharacterized protein LOC106821108 n=1 Tax=Priapulus caudatus TaxID=37621 RepID=A0ABM1F9Z5_PRICU|nr:PREDICTED: uncharacterized protein LOC106821108 [Priapulus caudatus]